MREPVQLSITENSIKSYTVYCKSIGAACLMSSAITKIIQNNF